MAERRRILVVGAGAIGGLYAAYLAKVSDVAVLDTNRAHVEAIRRHGLALTGRTESVTKLAAFASAAGLGSRRFDSVIILVKSQATEGAFASIRPALEAAFAHFGSARESRELGRRFGPAAEFQAVIPDRIDVRPVRVEHRDIGDFRQVSRVKAAYRARAHDENVFALGHRSGRMISGCRAPSRPVTLPFQPAPDPEQELQ